MPKEPWTMNNNHDDTISKEMLQVGAASNHFYSQEKK
jgi:hypothetical protein